MTTCSRQVCQRFLAKAPLARHLVAGKCAEDFWPRPPWHGILWQASVPKIFGQGPLSMTPCSRQVCQRFLAKAPLARHLVAGKCAEDFWPRPPWHGDLWQASVPKIFGQGPLSMAPCGGQVCRRLLAESPWAQHPAACNYADAAHARLLRPNYVAHCADVA